MSSETSNQGRWQALGLQILSKVPASRSIGLRELRTLFQKQRVSENRLLEGVSWLSNQGWVYLLKGQVIATAVGRRMLASKYIRKRFSYWRVLAVSDLNHQQCLKTILWCRCSCGTVREVRLDSLRSKGSRSCGCHAAKLISSAMVRHGARCPQSPQARTYQAWQRMKHRARIAKAALDQRWDQFEPFLADMGSCPLPGSVLLRIDPAKPWGPGNVLWGDRRHLGNSARQRERSGERFSWWRVISVQGGGCWCICDCGTVAQIPLIDLVRETSVHCDNPLSVHRPFPPPPKHVKVPKRSSLPGAAEVKAFQVLVKIRKDSTWATLSRELDMRLDDLHEPIIWLATHHYVTMEYWQVTDQIQLTAKGKMACDSPWIDRQVGFWQVLAVSKPPPRGLLWCACRCGRVKEVEQDDLRDRRSLGCGCERIC